LVSTQRRTDRRVELFFGKEAVHALAALEQRPRPSARHHVDVARRRRLGIRALGLAREAPALGARQRSREILNLGF